MCGIGGILRVWTPEQRDLALRTPHAQSIPETWLDILDDAVKHRGPDGQGRFRDRTLRADGSVVDVAFIHRRLSIIDHAGGHQPMVWQGPKIALSASSGSESGGRPVAGRLQNIEEVEAHNRFTLAEAHAATGPNPEGALRALTSHDRIAVVFNGCIYNHRELRAELQTTGHVFSSDHSDTEVLVHGWREWRLKLFERLEGMFALAVWSTADGWLVCGRDAFGEKPLHLTMSQDGRNVVHAFGSTHAAMVRLGAAAKFSTFERVRVDIGDWIGRGFSCMTPTWPTTNSVSPGEYVNLAARHLKPHPYLNGSLDLWKRPRDTDLSEHDVENLLSKAVQARTTADVPIGVFLSGGVDSSLVALLVKRCVGQARTFCVRMPDPRYDESQVALTVSRLLGTEHHTLDCRPQPAADLAMLVPQMGLPLGDSSLLATHWVSSAAAEHVRVTLGGDGGDELFAGYERYRILPRLNRWKSLLRLLPRDPLDRLSPNSRLNKAARLAEAARHSGYTDLLALFSHDDRRELLGGPPEEEGEEVGGIWTIEEAIKWDMWHYLPNDLLCKVDTASMAVPLEVRSPFLDRSLGAAALRAPIACLMPRGQRKGLLRQVARKYLPAEIVDRPKMGFAIPIGEWFRSDYGGLRTMLLDHLNSTEPFGPPSLGIDLNMAFIRQMLDEHLGTGPSGLVKRDHSQRLYMLLVLSIWAKWLGGLSR